MMADNEYVLLYSKLYHRGEKYLAKLIESFIWIECPICNLLRYKHEFSKPFQHKAFLHFAPYLYEDFIFNDFNTTKEICVYCNAASFGNGYVGHRSRCELSMNINIQFCVVTSIVRYSCKTKYREPVGHEVSRDIDDIAESVKRAYNGYGVETDFKDRTLFTISNGVDNRVIFCGRKYTMNNNRKSIRIYGRKLLAKDYGFTFSYKADRCFYGKMNFLTFWLSNLIE
jgi:hypothetical protein